MFDHVPLWLCEDITANCYMYCYFRNIFPPWSSQMTIILITNAMYHIRYTNGEYEFKRKNPHGLITAKHRLHQPTGKTPHYTGGNLVAFLMWNGIHLGYVSKNTWAVANKTVDISVSPICILRRRGAAAGFSALPPPPPPPPPPPKKSTTVANPCR